MKRSVEKEQFYTSECVVADCLDLLREHVQLEDFDLILEPSAGAGAFLYQLPEARRLGLDIDPRGIGILRQDFLQWRPGRGQGRVLTVGNPPYGQRAALAFDFIEHACTFSDVVAFVLPRSFNKWTFQNRMPPRFHLVASVNCENFEDPAGRPIVVNSVFQVWVKRDWVRPAINLPTMHPDFDMRHAHLSRTSVDDVDRLHRYDLAIAQVGGNFRPRPASSITRGSYWFVKLHNPKARAYFDRLDFSFLKGTNTAHASLSKRDIIFAYSQIASKETSVDLREAAANLQTELF